ncbi:MAG: hypothetical protein EXS05_10470 [Planctomycetaceae bacterium]|nr:hypothetical protein [Planctomycetaceae bacterium]
MKSAELLLLFDVALAALGVFVAEQGRMVPAWSIFGALAVLGVWQLVLFTTVRDAGQRFGVEPFFRATHYVQAVLQATIYVYLSLYWGDIRTYAPLILAQILVGYLCEMLLAWSRGRKARMGLAIVPVILSTNLFMWFKDEYFYFQFLMIAMAFFSKEFLTWNYGGKRRHIFNPSAFPLAAVSVILLASGQVGLTVGVDLVAAFELPPNFYEVIFLLGLITQALFLTTPVSLGAVVALCLLYQASWLVLGEPLTPAPIAIQVFLGLTFLVTDPATSPRTSLGKFLFGMAYGIGVFISMVLLQLSRQPGYFDKLLAVPVVNLMVPLFDRLSDRIERSLLPALMRAPGALPRFGWLGACLVFFLLLDPSLKVLQDRPLSTLLPPPRVSHLVSDDLKRLLLNYIECRKIYPEAYKPFGLLYEFAHLSAIREVYQRPLSHPGFARGAIGP